MSEALAKRVLEKVRNLQVNLKADQKLLVYYETASGEITKKQVLTRLQCKHAIASWLACRSPYCPDSALPRSQMTLHGSKLFWLSMTLRASELPFVQPLSPGPSSACVAKPLTVLKR